MGGRGPGVASPWMLMPAPPDMADALCADGVHDPDDWFEDGTGDRYRAHLQAVAVCGVCPELVVCRDWALAQDDRLWGIWGGLSRGQRRLIRKVGDRGRDD